MSLHWIHFKNGKVIHCCLHNGTNLMSEDIVSGPVCGLAVDMSEWREEDYNRHCPKCEKTLKQALKQ